MPFFEILRANKKFKKTPECEESFQNLKQTLRTLPPLAKSAKNEAFSLYIDISPVANSVPVKNMAKGQIPVYYVSKVFTKAEMNYLEVDKYLCALVVSAKIDPYFHEHEITVLINEPLKHFLQKI